LVFVRLLAAALKLPTTAASPAGFRCRGAACRARSSVERNSTKWKLVLLLLPRRKGIRIPGYDYSWAGAYFVTICSRDRHNLFGELNGQQLAPNALGGIVRDCWREIPTHFPHVVTDAFVLMPDHIHGILLFEQDDLRASWGLRARHAAPLQQIRFSR
jgi:hypothetical protein